MFMVQDPCIGVVLLDSTAKGCVKEVSGFSTGEIQDLCSIFSYYYYYYFCLSP